MIKSHDKSAGKQLDEDKEVDALTMLRFTQTFMEIQRIVDARNQEIELLKERDEVLGSKKGGKKSAGEPLALEKTYESQAKHLVRRGQVDKGIQYMDMAVEASALERVQVTKLVAARSKYHILLGHWAAAVQDADEVLQEGTEVNALCGKGEALFNMCWFEQVTRQEKLLTCHLS